VIGGAARSNLVAAIEETCRSGFDLDELRRRLLPRIRRAVPVDALWWAVADPSTLLFARASREEIPAETGPYFVANEFLEDDVNKWTDLARRSSPVRTLWQATGGTPERSARYRDIFRPLGLGDELRAVLRTDDECWGYLCAHREGADGFSAEEARFVETIAPHLAAGFRLALLVERSSADTETSPGLLVLAEDGTPLTMNAAAGAWLDELGGGADGGALPLEVVAVATRLRRGDGSRLQARTSSGRWVVLHASWLGEPPARTTAVIVEQATPEEVLPVLLAAYGLTDQERRVTGLVCRGLSTAEIAAGLHVTANTVQDHLKSIFTKTGVRSRRELVATLLQRQYR
jgi:DNA-binding CsgD family transcriptional regulator